MLYVEGFGYVLVLMIEGKDIPPEKAVPQRFLLSGVN
jgi:hypothetical protein